MKHLYRICIALCALLALAAPHTLRAQEKCGTMERDAELRRLYPQEMGTLDDMERWIAAKRAQMASARDFDQVLYVPVVVHVIHNGEALGSGTNISDAQVMSQIRVLNDDYRRRPNTRGYVEHPDAVDTKIEFVLAKRDPSGRPTTGIDRVSRVAKGWNAGPYGQNYTDNTIKPGSVWDANRYLNFWCLDLGNSLLGYAQFPPSSGLLGMQCSTGAASTDGVAINTDAFGSIDDGNFNLTSSFNLGRTLTHELGHYFSLRHIWGDANCGTDYCEDTPVHQTANNGCFTHPKPNSCGTPDEMFENYMDYSDDACLGIFTRDQAVRMRAVLLDGPRRTSLLSSPALTAPIPHEVILAALETPNTDVCSGATNMRVRFNNTGVRNLTALTLQAYVDGNLSGVASFTGRNVAFNNSDTLTIQGVDLQPGRHIVQIIAVSPNNVTGDSANGDTIEVPIFATSGRALPFVENFEAPNALPLDWFMTNPNSDCYQWRIQTMSTGSAGAVSAAAYIQLYNVAAQNQVDNLYTPLVDLTNETSASLSFRYAHARSSTNDLTELRVEVSEDCGETFGANPALTLTGAALLTVATTQNGTNYIPTAESQWRTATVDLTAYLGRRIRIRFAAVNKGGGNNLYVDNIGVERSVSQTPTITGFSPDTVQIGDTVTVLGTNLESTVEIGFTQNRRSSRILASTPTQVRVSVPAGAVTGPLRATTLGGTATSTRNLIVALAPNITSFTPATGTAGTSVTISGANFLVVRQVLFNGVAAASFNASGSTAVTAVAPAGVTTGVITVIGKYGTAVSRAPFIVGNITRITSAALTTCSETYTDPGGLSNYANSANVTQTITPLPGNLLSVSIMDLDLESGFDFLYIYDGPTATGSPMASLTGTQAPTAPITATNAAGVLTFRFTSDNSETGRGFIATLSCVARSRPDIISFNPVVGNTGTQVIVTGPSVGFSDSVWFNGVSASSVTRLSTTQVRAVVPAGASTGPIRVKSTQLGSDTSLGVFTILAIPGYCSPTHPECAQGNLLYISKVEMDGTSLHNTSTCATSGSTESYTQYLPADSTSTSLKKGGAYLLTVTTRSNARVGAWLDWNRNGSFEAGEFFTIPATTGTSNRSRILVRIPAAADTGLAVLRVRSGATTQAYTAGDACSNRTNGEAEDYIVHIMGSCDSIAPAQGSPDTFVCRNMTANLNVTSANDVRWYMNMNEPWVATGLSYTTPAITATTTVQVVAVQDNCESLPDAIVLTVIAPIATFTASGNDLSAISHGPGYTYQWYMGTTLIPGATDSTYTITQTGTYSVAVTFSGCTVQGAGQLVTYVSVASKLDASALQIWPNPTQGKLNVQASQSGLFTLSDAMGREVYRTTLVAGKQKLNLPALSSGIYMGRYISPKGVATRQIEIE